MGFFFDKAQAESGFFDNADLQQKFYDLGKSLQSVSANILTGSLLTFNEVN